MMEKQNPARKETIFCAGFSLLCKLRKNTDVKLHKNELQFCELYAHLSAQS